jgi:hypothetical protein
MGRLAGEESLLIQSTLKKEVQMRSMSMSKLRTGWASNRKTFRWHYIIQRDQVRTSLCGHYSAEPERALLDGPEHEHVCSECLYFLVQNLVALYQLALSQETSPSSELSFTRR